MKTTIALLTSQVACRDSKIRDLEKELEKKDEEQISKLEEELEKELGSDDDSDDRGRRGHVVRRRQPAHRLELQHDRRQRNNDEDDSWISITEFKKYRANLKNKITVLESTVDAITDERNEARSQAAAMKTLCEARKDQVSSLIKDNNILRRDIINREQHIKNLAWHRDQLHDTVRRLEKDCEYESDTEDDIFDNDEEDEEEPKSPPRYPAVKVMLIILCLILFYQSYF